MPGQPGMGLGQDLCGALERDRIHIKEKVYGSIP
jgi:hypothetical protein